MSDLQLERSVLEAKERDELFAIALALGTTPAARTQEGGPGLAESSRSPAWSKNHRQALRSHAPLVRAVLPPPLRREVVPADDSQQLELAATNGNGAQPAAPAKETKAPDSGGGQRAHRASG